MDFKTLYESISPRLKQIAKTHEGYICFIDKNDLYQEMCFHLWDRFRDDKGKGFNEAYIIRSCKFHLLNYIRKKREKKIILSLEKPINKHGEGLKDILTDSKESLEIYIDKKMAIDAIKNNGFTTREKQVFRFY
jgi:RNA polymerase sigma factor (sigma-70 family)